MSTGNDSIPPTNESGTVPGVGSGDWLASVFAPLPAWMFGDSVEARNALQASGRVHPYTCGNDRMDAAHRAYQAAHGGDFGQLVAIDGGWMCPACDYRQPLSSANGADQPRAENAAKSTGQSL